MTKKKTKFKKMEGEERYTSTEMPMSQVIARAHEEESKHGRQMKIIEQSIKYLHDLNNLESETFHLIHVNWHCVVARKDRFDELNIVKIFYPAELAISEFSLKKGLVRRFNKFMNVTLPKGYASEARDRKEKVHKLDVENEHGESDLKLVYAEIKSFLTHGQHNGSIPPLYTRPESAVWNTSTEAVCSVLKMLYFHAHRDASFDEAALSGDEWESEFKVYPINKLLYELGKIYAPDNVTSETIADIYFQKDPYMYQEGIACELHEELDGIQNCSLSMVSRWAMLIRETCCKEQFANEKLHIPAVETVASGYKPKCFSFPPPNQSSVSETSSSQHEKLYPAMKQKDMAPPPNASVTFVQSASKPASVESPPAQTSSGVSVGSAWARPLVYQPPNSVAPNISGGGPSGSQQNSSATENFPPLGGLRISQEPTGGKKNQQNKKKK